MSKYNQKGIAHIFITLLLIAGITLSIYLVQTKTNLLPKASENQDPTNTNYNMGVLVIKYFPPDASGQNLDAAITGVNQPLSHIRTYVNDLTNQGITQISNGTKFHGYKDTTALSAINYQVVDTKEYLEALPVSANKVPWNPAMYRPDYQKILARENICDYVDNKNVKQIWLWGYHYGNIEPVEADMAMGNSAQSYWNYPGYGDVSNSEQTNDLPTCNKTYTLYNYNYGRGLGEMLEDHGHQIEAVFRFVDSTLWDKFQKPNGDTNPQVVNHCGWTHSPPNSGDWSGDRGQYDWNDKTIVKSDCEDWQPEGGGIVKDSNCNNWYEPFYNKSYVDIPCQEDLGVAFKIWWMQNIPGRNNTLTYQGKPLRNWWDFYADFDTALSLGKSLTSRPPTIAVVCSVNPLQINIGGSATWRVDAEGGVRPYDISWDGTDGLHAIGDTGQTNTATVTYTLAGTKTGLVRVKDQANGEVFKNCPSITVIGPSPSPSASSFVSPSPTSSPTPSPSPSSSPVIKPGDIDRDGDVDIFDYSLFIQDFVSRNIRSDLNGNNRVDIFDYNILVQNFGR